MNLFDIFNSMFENTWAKIILFSIGVMVGCFVLGADDDDPPSSEQE